MVLSINTFDHSIGGIHIIREISTDPYKCVFLGKRIYDSGKQVKVALKVFQLPLEGVQYHKKSFLKEVQFLQKLRHPHILPIISAGIDRGIPFIATEYTRSGSLYDLMQKFELDPLPREQALLIIKQIAKALQYAQSLGVMHCNLKPRNVLFNKRGMVQITDFHIPSLRSMALIPSSVSSAFLAPEQLVDIVSPQSDQYALGCIAYELLTGKPPFTGQPGLQTKISQPIPPAQINPSLPPHVNQAILKAMAQRLSERFTTIQAFIDALSAPESLQALSVSATDQSLQQEHTSEPESASAALEGPTPFPSTLPATPTSLPLTETHELPQVVPDAQISPPAAPTTYDNRDEPPPAPLDLVPLKDPADTHPAPPRPAQLQDQVLPYPVPSPYTLPASTRPQSAGKQRFKREQKVLLIACIIAVITGGTLLLVRSSLISPQFRPTTSHTNPSPTATFSAIQYPVSAHQPKTTASPTATASTISTKGTAIITRITPTPSPTVTSAPTASPFPTPTPTPSPTASPFPTPTPAPTPAPVQLLTIYPETLHPYDCYHKNYYQCSLTLSLSSNASSSTAWYVTDENIGVSLNPPQGQISPGESINITALVYSDCNSNSTGKLTFVSTIGIGAAVMRWSC